jgi:DNA-binding FrmR family transcriptional regulator
MEPEQQSEIIRRLRCTAGHLNAIVEMSEAGRPCEQILHQINAVQAALRAAGIKIIECQAQSSQDVILNSTSVTQRTAELQQLQALYRILVEQYSHRNEVIYE